MGMHQGSALSPLLFVIVMEAISREFRVALPWELLYADDMAVIAETEDELIKRLNEWKDNMESKGMRVNMNKTILCLTWTVNANLLKQNIIVIKQMCSWLPPFSKKISSYSSNQCSS